jgi:hypothetical protein
MKISLAEYRRHCADYDGYCTHCKEINPGGHEPDAMGYLCDECNMPESMGVETAMIMEYITIIEEDT